MKRSSILVDDFCALERSSGYLTAEKRFEIKLQWASKWELSSPWNRHISDVAATVGQSSVGSQVPGAPGFVVAFQERVTPALYHDLSTDRNMGWVRPDSWLTYLTLNAPYPKSPMISESVPQV